MYKGFDMKSKLNGLGICETWALLFKRNEEHFKSKNYTKILNDEQITEIMCKTFPTHSSSEIFRQTNRVRNRYNRGLLTHGKIPKNKSCRYSMEKNKIVIKKKRSKK